MKDLVVMTEIVEVILIEEDHSVSVSEEEVAQIVEVAEQGPAGAAGPPGPQGVQGPPGPLGQGSDANYVHTQVGASALWTVVHNLGKYPAVIIVDSGNTVVVGDIEYLSVNALEIQLSSAFSGYAYLN